MLFDLSPSLIVRIPILLALMGSAFSSDAVASIPWRVSVERAVSEAASSGKPLFVSVSTSWCHYCKKLDRETLSNDSVANHIEKCFVPLKIDGDANRELVQMLGVRSYPTMVIMSPNMKVLSRLKGYRTANQLNGALESVCTSIETHRAVSRRSVPPTKQTVNSRPTPGETTVSTSHVGLNHSVFGDHCPVTSLQARQLTKSDRRFALKYRGFDVWFATAEARETFEANPDRYWPLLDGHCVVSALDENVLRLGDWSTGVSYADRIWFFSSATHMEEFNQRAFQYLQKLMDLADRNTASEQNRRRTH